MSGRCGKGSRDPWFYQPSCLRKEQGSPCGTCVQRTREALRIFCLEHSLGHAAPEEVRSRYRKRLPECLGNGMLSWYEEHPPKGFVKMKAEWPHDCSEVERGVERGQEKN